MEITDSIGWIAKIEDQYYGSWINLENGQSGCVEVLKEAASVLDFKAFKEAGLLNIEKAAA